MIELGRRGGDWQRELWVAIGEMPRRVAQVACNLWGPEAVEAFYGGLRNDAPAGWLRWLATLEMQFAGGGPLTGLSTREHSGNWQRVPGGIGRGAGRHSWSDPL